jgi:hypothetical protein
VIATVTPSSDHPAPEQDLLARVESIAADVGPSQQAPASGQPGQVLQPRQVVTHEGQEDNDRGHREQGSDEVVRRLADAGQRREQRVSEHRQQQMLAKQHGQTGQPQHHEATGVRPMDAAFDQREAFDHPAGGRFAQADRSTQQVERGDQDQHRDQAPSSVLSDWPVAQLAPLFSALLDQHPGFAVRDVGEVGFSIIDVAPDRGVVQRLFGLAGDLRTRVVACRLEDIGRLRTAGRCSRRARASRPGTRLRRSRQADGQARCGQHDCEQTLHEQAPWIGPAITGYVRTRSGSGHGYASQIPTRFFLLA